MRKLLIYLLCFVFVPQIFANDKFMKGMVFGATYWPEENLSYVDYNLTKLKAMGVNSIMLNISWYVENCSDPSIEPWYRNKPGFPDTNWFSPTLYDEEIIQIITKAHSIGMTVMLRPQVDSLEAPFGGCQRWQLQWNTGRWDELFESYLQFMSYYAEIAEAQNVEIFIMGAEMSSMTHPSESLEDTDSRWRYMISEIRKKFSGKLTYSDAFNGSRNDTWSSPNSITFWDALDYIGFEIYRGLTVNEKSPSMIQLVNGVKDIFQNYIEPLANQYQKDIIITEINYYSFDGVNTNPISLANISPYTKDNSPVDHQEQADCYEAILKTINEIIKEKNYLKGIFWWEGHLINPTDNYSWVASDKHGWIWFKPAEDVLTYYYKDIIEPVAEISLNRTSLCFTENSVGDRTNSQALTISNSGGDALRWNISCDQSWLYCSLYSGIDFGVTTVSVDAANLSVGSYEGTVTVTAPNALNSPQKVYVALNVYDSNQTLPPFGDFSTPLDGSTAGSSIPITGWALDDIEVESVKVYRGELNSLIYIGDAVFVEGARTDIEEAYPDYPLNYKSGWGYMLLTNFLPNGGNGTFKVHTIITDVEGHQVILGTKTIICDNINAVKPFGAIDTPAQGGEASGSSFRNNGWVLTPLPNSVPTDGSSINVFIDGVYLGHPTYNVYRADIAAFFPGFANSDGAHAYFEFDTTAYSNGIHSIYWTAEDSAGNSDGIGSRYFTIQNTGLISRNSSERYRQHAKDKESYTFSQILAIPIDYEEPIKVKKNFKINSAPKFIELEKDGTFNIKIRELERIVIELSNESSLRAGYTIIGRELRPLPIGSTLDTRKGIFYWQPGPGFLGEHRFSFLEKMQNGELSRKNVIVTIEPKITRIVKMER